MSAGYGCGPELPGLLHGERRAQPRPARPADVRPVGPAEVRPGCLAGTSGATWSGALAGIASTASLLIGVAAAGGGRGDLWLVGLACLAAGALAMAAGEYASAGGSGRGQHPLHAAMLSGAAFAGGAGVPLLAAVLAPPAHLAGWLAVVSLLGLAALGAGQGRPGRPPLKAVLDLAAWGAAAMFFAAALGRACGPL